MNDGMSDTTMTGRATKALYRRGRPGGFAGIGELRRGGDAAGRQRENAPCVAARRSGPEPIVLQLPHHGVQKSRRRDAQYRRCRGIPHRPVSARPMPPAQALWISQLRRQRRTPSHLRDGTVLKMECATWRQCQKNVFALVPNGTDFMKANLPNKTQRYFCIFLWNARAATVTIGACADVAAALPGGSRGVPAHAVPPTRE